MSKHPYHERKTREAQADAARLRAERDAAWADAARQFERAESEYEIVDAIAKLLTELGRPAEEEIADGVRWLITERARLLSLLPEEARNA